MGVEFRYGLDSMSAESKAEVDKALKETIIRSLESENTKKEISKKLIDEIDIEDIVDLDKIKEAITDKVIAMLEEKICSL